MVMMTSCGDIDLLRDPGSIWEPGLPPIGSYGINYELPFKKIFQVIDNK
jgi:hypothetical protein